MALQEREKDKEEKWVGKINMFFFFFFFLLMICKRKEQKNHVTYESQNKGEEPIPLSNKSLPK